MKPGLKKILRLFDYFKEAYRVNVNNKTLYKPQVIYALVKSALLLVLLVISSFLVESFLQASQSTTSYKEVFMSPAFIGLSIGTILSIILIALANSYVEAGLINMYVKAVAGTQVTMDDWKEGARNYFTKIFVGNLLINIFWFVALVPYIIVGFVTLGLGFTIIPVLVSALLLVWKIIVIKENLGPIDAMKKSVTFGRANLFPASVYVIIINTISGTSSGGAGGSNPASMSNVFNSSSSDGIDSDTATIIAESTISLIKWIMIGTSTYISIGVFVFQLVAIVLSVFFSLTTVILYLDNWSIDETSVEMEVA